jgi:uncharacterized membrane protein YgdD (TMEM256/DUF423 family)
MEWIDPFAQWLNHGSVFFWSGILMVIGLLVHRYSMYTVNSGIPIMCAGAVLFVTELFVLALYGGFDAILLMGSLVFSESNPWNIHGMTVWSGHLYMLACLGLLVQVGRVKE